MGPLQKIPGKAAVKHALKTAIAASASLMLARLAGLEHGYWAVISAIIVMQSDLGSSIQAGLNRVAGTASGALVGALSLYFFPPDPAMLALAVFLTILLCSYLTGLHTSFRVGAITVAIVLLSGTAGQDPTTLALERFVEISLGVLSAVATAYLLWPARAGHKLQKALGRALREDAKHYQAVVNYFIGGLERSPIPQNPRLLEHLSDTRELHSLAQQESVSFRARRKRDLDLIAGAERFAERIQALERTSKASPALGYQLNLSQELAHLADATIESIRRVAAALEAGRDPAPYPQLKSAIATCEARLNELREQDATKQYPLSDIALFFSFYHGMKSLARDIHRTFFAGKG